MGIDLMFQAFINFLYDIILGDNIILGKTVVKTVFQFGLII